MKRELLLLRHGKSDWSQPVADLERPLKKRGKRGAQLMGAWLARRGLVPGRILTSPAERARATAEKCAKAMGLTRDMVETDADLYEAGPEALARVVAACPARFSRLMIVGHNPGLEDFLGGWLEAPPPVPEDGKLLPTAGLARLVLDGDWASLAPGQARLVEIRRSRELPPAFAYPFPDGPERRPRPAYYYTQSAVLPCRWRGGQLEVMLIGSSGNRHWSLPKGIVESGLSPAESALEEAFEEAGVRGRIIPVATGHYRHAKWGATCEVELFAMQVEHELPSSARQEPHRQRGWFHPAEAARRVASAELGAQLLALCDRLTPQQGRRE